jgi:hypothetical protein
MLPNIVKLSAMVHASVSWVAIFEERPVLGMQVGSSSSSLVSYQSK